MDNRIRWKASLFLSQNIQSMKNQFLSLLAIISFLNFSKLNAQVDYPHTITLNAGGSLIGTLIDAVGTFDGDSFQANSIPAIQGTYGYRVNNWFSVGPAVSYQAFVFKGENYRYTDENGEEIVEDAKIMINRTNIAVRPLFHYGNNPSLDMYSGARIGLTHWGISSNTNDEELKEEVDLGFNTGIGFQVIAFGMRGYFNENFGLNMEIGFGAPHIISGGLNYRF